LPQQWVSIEGGKDVSINFIRALAEEFLSRRDMMALAVAQKKSLLPLWGACRRDDRSANDPAHNSSKRIIQGSMSTQGMGSKNDISAHARSQRPVQSERSCRD
jgi:hypothetical protein